MLEANRHCLLAAPIAVEMRRGLNGSMGRKERAEPSLTRRRDRLSDPGVNPDAARVTLLLTFALIDTLSLSLSLSWLPTCSTTTEPTAP